MDLKYVANEYIPIWLLSNLRPVYRSSVEEIGLL